MKCVERLFSAFTQNRQANINILVIFSPNVLTCHLAHTLPAIVILLWSRMLETIFHIITRETLFL